jgi:hypothetical protein
MPPRARLRVQVDLHGRERVRCVDEHRALLDEREPHVLVVDEQRRKNATVAILRRRREQDADRLALSEQRILSVAIDAGRNGSLPSAPSSARSRARTTTSSPPVFFTTTPSPSLTETA